MIPSWIFTYYYQSEVLMYVYKWTLGISHPNQSAGYDGSHTGHVVRGMTSKLKHVLFSSKAVFSIIFVPRMFDTFCFL